MTVQELIENLEEIEELDVVIISKNKYCNFYEGEDIEFIDANTLDLEVKNYTYRTDKVKRRKCRIVDIQC